MNIYRLTKYRLTKYRLTKSQHVLFKSGWLRLIFWFTSNIKEHTYAGLAELIISQRFINSASVKSAIDRYTNYYTEHCSVGPTKLIETIPSTTTTTARMM